MTNLYKNQILLNIPEIYELKLAKFIYLLQNQNLPKSFYDRFVKLSDVHSYATRHLL